MSYHVYAFEVALCAAFFIAAGWAGSYLGWRCAELTCGLRVAITCVVGFALLFTLFDVVGEIICFLDSGTVWHFANVAEVAAFAFCACFCLYRAPRL